MSFDSVTAFAPSSVGNVAVGFDILGHALEGPGDRVTARLASRPGVHLTEITGHAEGVPTDARSNTAGRAVLALLAHLESDAGVELALHKGTPPGSGLGGSAASAVAAVVAAAKLLDCGLAGDDLYPFAVAGEEAASGGPHGDNVGSQLLGGLVLSTARYRISIPVPAGLTAVAVHPDCTVETRRARALLEDPYPIATMVAQSANLALVLAGCYRGDFGPIRAGLADVMVEPRRAGLIPGFHRVRQAALDHGALGASISGAGPTVFGWFENPDAAAGAGEAMQAAFRAAGHEARIRISPVSAPGARIL